MKKTLIEENKELKDDLDYFERKFKEVKRENLDLKKENAELKKNLANF